MNFQDIHEMEDETQQLQATYQLFDEDNRLTHSKAAQVEFLTTTHFLNIHLPPNAKVLDLGAGTGAYSFYLEQKGHQVWALELAQRNLEVFRQKLQPHHRIHLQAGTATDLRGYEDDFFDAVLVFGPLYHLHREEDRLQCIREALRVCKPQGMAFFAFISHDIIHLTELTYRPDYFLTGSYDTETFRLEDFPFVFHTVDQCRGLLAQGGVRIHRQIAADGASELLADRINAMDDKSFSQYLRYHFYICEKPEFLGFSNHLLFLGQKESAV